MLQLIVNPSTIRQSGKQIFAEIYFQFNYESYFPERGWDDFVVIILNWWIESTILSCSGVDSICYFMDGPYYFVIEPENDNFNVVFISKKNEKEIIYSKSIKQKDFLRLLLKITNIVLREVMNKHMVSEEIVKLKKNYRDLQSFTSDFKKI